jgi:hypothetical protein
MSPVGYHIPSFQRGQTSFCKPGQRPTRKNQCVQPPV